MLRSTALALAIAVGLPGPRTLSAQLPTGPVPMQTRLLGPAGRSDTLPPDAPSAPAPGHAIRWYEPLAAGGGIALISALDEPLADHFRDHRSQTGDDVANAWSKVGTYGVGIVTAGVLAGGLISHDSAVTKTGLRLAFSVLLAGAADQGIKLAVGRQRPNITTNAFDFDSFRHFDTAFPSGHTTLAFAMATSLADDIHRPWATVGLYGVATGVAVSRVYQEEHWLTDVIGGAALGVVSAKLVSGRWRLFGLRTPHFLMSGTGPALGWSMQFRE